MTNNKEKILIIGGAGYIGSVLTPKLVENNFNVTVIDVFKNQDNIFNNILFNKNLDIKKWMQEKLMLIF